MRKIKCRYIEPRGYTGLTCQTYLRNAMHYELELYSMIPAVTRLSLLNAVKKYDVLEYFEKQPVTPSPPIIPGTYRLLIKLKHSKFTQILYSYD